MSNILWKIQHPPDHRVDISPVDEGGDVLVQVHGEEEGVNDGVRAQPAKSQDRRRSCFADTRTLTQKRASEKGRVKKGRIKKWSIENRVKILTSVAICLSASPVDPLGSRALDGAVLFRAPVWPAAGERANMFHFLTKSHNFADKTEMQLLICNDECEDGAGGDGGGGDGGAGDLVGEVVSPLSLDCLVSYRQPDAFWRGHLGGGYSFEGSAGQEKTITINITIISIISITSEL